VIAAVREVPQPEEAFPANDRLLVIPFDVTDTEQIERSILWGAACFGGVDILVNTAGYGELGWFEAMDEASIRRQFEVNVFGTMRVARAVLPLMRARRSGRILTVSGVGGMVAVPTGAVYCASRFALEGWMEGLAAEVADFGIRCTLIQSGYFSDQSADVAPTRFTPCSISDYDLATRAVMKSLSGVRGDRSANVSRLADIVWDIARLRAPPLRFAAGTDALNAIHRKIKAMQSEYAFFENLSASADSVA
jgi:NAD(P)-dependent dehydrogenase (short-subunit alcohol dehydrogenase family)